MIDIYTARQIREKLNQMDPGCFTPDQAWVYFHSLRAKMQDVRNVDVLLYLKMAMMRTLVLGNVRANIQVKIECPREGERLVKVTDLMGLCNDVATGVRPLFVITDVSYYDVNA